MSALPRQVPQEWDLGMDFGYAYAGRAVTQQQAGQRAWLAALAGAVVVGLALLGLGQALTARPAGGGRHLSTYRPAGLGETLLQVVGVVVQANVAVAAPPPPSPAPAPPPAAPPVPGDRPAVAPPSADHGLIAPPSIAAARIDAVLAQWGSPAAGQGAAFYDLGRQYGIDPAYALAFFIHESGAGTKGVARFTNSIGNIRTTPGYRDYEGYRAYDTWAAGIADWYKLIKELYIAGWGKRTVAQIIPTYAPAGDNNDPTSYIASVTGLVDSWQQK